MVEYMIIGIDTEDSWDGLIPIRKSWDSLIPYENFWDGLIQMEIIGIVWFQVEILRTIRFQVILFMVEYDCWYRQWRCVYFNRGEEYWVMKITCLEKSHVA